MMNEQERITVLENDVTELKIGQKVNEINIAEVKTSVTEIKQNTNKLVWLVGTALIITLLNMMLKGGVHL